MTKRKEAIFKFEIVSNNKEQDNCTLTLKVRFLAKVEEPKIEARGENFYTILYVENYEVISDESTKNFKQYFTVKIDYASYQHELIVRLDVLESCLYMNIPTVING